MNSAIAAVNPHPILAAFKHAAARMHRHRRFGLKRDVK
jgi:hypothetical protein